MSNRRIWSAADKRAIVAEAEEPGAAVSMVARRHNAAHRRLLVVADVRNAIPKPQPLATAKFATLGMLLTKIAGRIIETATRVCVAFAADCPEAELFIGVTRGHALNGRSTQRPLIKTLRQIRTALPLETGALLIGNVQFRELFPSST